MNASTRLPVCAYIGIGSNLDNPLEQVCLAIDSMAALPQTTLDAVSHWYGSTPAGGEPGQPDYVNGAARLYTSLPPLALLDALQNIEHKQGRIRLSHWGPRTLDLDILLYGSDVIVDRRLSIPHPYLETRAFVLQPLTDLDPALTLPNGASVRSLLADCDSRDIWRLPDAPGSASTFSA
jgi:2-amino-4-hydroxy-6-hydroxymethyldihydropteridine diphosphokinase